MNVIDVCSAMFGIENEVYSVHCSFTGGHQKYCFTLWSIEKYYFQYISIVLNNIKHNRIYIHFGDVLEYGYFRICYL